MQKVECAKSVDLSLSEKYRLDNIDHLLLRQIIEFPNTTTSELARLVSYSHTGVRKRLEKPSFKKALADLQESTDESLRRLAGKAIRKLLSLVDDDDKKIALKSCEIVLTHFLNLRKLGGSSHLERIVFTTQIGEDGSINREVTEVSKS